MARIHDVSVPLVPGLPVYPGDPPLVIEAVQRARESPYGLARLVLTTYSGTHGVKRKRSAVKFPVNIYFVGNLRQRRYAGEFSRGESHGGLKEDSREPVLLVLRREAPLECARCPLAGLPGMRRIVLLNRYKIKNLK